MRAISILTITAILVPLSSNAQQAGPCRDREVLVSVLDSNGLAMTSLRPSGFRAVFRDRPLVISAIRPAPAQRRAVLLLDRSRSMIGPEGRTWRIATAAAITLVSAIPDKWPVALITVGDHVEVKDDFSTSRTDLVATLAAYATDETFPKGRTALVDGISKALEFLHPLQFGDTITRSDVNSKKRVADISKTIELLAADPGIVLQLQVPDAIEKWQSWGLELVDEQGHRRKHFTLSYPHKLGPRDCTIVPELGLTPGAKP